MENFDDLTDLSESIWKDPSFPNFYTNEKALEHLEESFAEEAKKLRGGDFSFLKVEELYSNYKIEGIELNRDSLHSSLTSNLAGTKPGDKERGAVELLNLVTENKDKPLTHDLLQEMNKSLLVNDPDHSGVAGQYVGDMMIVKGNARFGEQVIVERGVPKERVNIEMDKFVEWYNGRDPSKPLQNALQGHLHFEKIHPFADGNGRIGRAVMNMSLMSDLKLDDPLAVSKGIQAFAGDYYKSFETNQLDLTDYVRNSGKILQKSLTETRKIVELTEMRRQLYNGGFNDRQVRGLNKVIAKEISSNFEGSLNRNKYIKLLGGNIDAKTAQRDLADLAQKGLLVKVGTLKATKYEIPIIRELHYQESKELFVRTVDNLKAEAMNNGFKTVHERAEQASTEFADSLEGVGKAKKANLVNRTQAYTRNEISMSELKKFIPRHDS